MKQILKFVTVAVFAGASLASAQQPATPPAPTGITPGTSLGIPKFAPGEQGSRNIKVMSHIPLGGPATVGDIEIEQELSRPYVYMSRLSGYSHDIGFDIISVKDPDQPSPGGLGRREDQKPGAYCPDDLLPANSGTKFQES